MITPSTDHDDYDVDWSEEPDCQTCGGDGWGYRGYDWTNDDPVNEPDGQFERCWNCGGSGLAKDQWLW